MKKVLSIVVSCLFLVAGNAFAHCGKCGMGDEKKEMDMTAMIDEKVGNMSKDLSLNDEQKSKVAVIMKEKMEKKHQLMQENQKAMDDLRESYTTKLKEVLSEEQFKKWEATKGDHEGKCPMCKDGKMCKMCKMMKDKAKGDCTKCKDGKMCKKCKLNKENGSDSVHETHEGHQEGKEGNKGNFGG